MYQSNCIQNPPPPPLPRRPWDICLPCQSQGGAFAKFALGPGICQPRSQPQAFDTQAVSYQNITTQMILLKKKQADWLICQGREQIEDVSKGIFSILCLHFFIAYELELHSEVGSYQRESTFFWLLNQISVYKTTVLITVNFTALMSIIL